MLSPTIPCSRRVAVWGVVVASAAEGDAHGAAVPESCPASEPARGSNVRFKVKFKDLVGPVTNAPMEDPSNAVTWPLS